MSGPRADFAAGDLTFVPVEPLAEWMLAQRWFATKAADLSEVAIRRVVPLADEPPLVVAIVEVRFPAGTHHLYQVPLGLRPAGPHDAAAICSVDGLELYDALADPAQLRSLGRLLSGSARLERDEGALEFHMLDHAGGSLAQPAAIRQISGEQSNTSLVYDEAVAVKVYRRLQAGVNPELEMLRFLSEHGFEHMPRLLGWYEHRGAPLEATLGVASAYVPDARDGWELALEALAGGRGREFVTQLRSLGEATGAMHAALGSDAEAADFAPEACTPEAMALLVADVDEAIGDTLLELPDLPALLPLAGRAEEVQEHLRAVGPTAGGQMVRVHGDYHLGQAMLSAAGWVIVDFEGEPARSLSDRRRKRPPLRDVAGMLRSFAYAAGAAEREHGAAPSAEWEEQARGAFLEGYAETVDQSLLPSEASQLRRMLAFFELEKAVYELRYELDHRPDWVPIPVRAIERLLNDLAGA